VVTVPKKIIEVLVGFFMILGIIALAFMAIKVSGLAAYSTQQSFYKVYADFDNIGSLKVRSPVMISGVWIGQVSAINLDPTSYRARVTLDVSKDQKLPTDTSASIYTQGLLGSNYISLTPGYEESFLKEGSYIETTQPAIILEKLIGQFLYSLKGDKDDKDKDKSENPNKNVE